MPSLFDAVEMAPRDPILGLNEQFAADPNPAKVNLGVGVYYDENGKLPILRCVRAAEQMLIEAAKPRGYLPIDGIAAYDDATQALVFGAEHPARKAGRIATVQAVGGTGGLKVGADLLKRMRPDATILISEPSWENHRALFEGAGFAVGTYPYYDPTAKVFARTDERARSWFNQIAENYRSAFRLPAVRYSLRSASSRIRGSARNVSTSKQVGSGLM